MYQILHTEIKGKAFGQKEQYLQKHRGVKITDRSRRLQRKVQGDGNKEDKMTQTER